MYHVYPVISAASAEARICSRGLIVIAPPELMRPQRATLLAKFEEGADELARIIDSEHASWAQTDGTSLLEHGHASVACLKTSCRLPISICTVLREMATRSKSARITGTSCRLEPTSGGTDRDYVPLELFPKFRGSPPGVPTIIGILK